MNRAADHRKDTMRTFASLDDFAAAKGEVLGTSDWFTVTQEAVDQFADATGDHQWIHVDPVKAAAGPYGGTIAHGFMTLSLLPVLMHQIYEVKGLKMALNYGVNKVRFPSPVKVGSRVRATSTLVDAEDLGNGTQQFIVSTVIETEGGGKPACVAESVLRYMS